MRIEEKSLPPKIARCKVVHPLSDDRWLTFSEGRVSLWSNGIQQDVLRLEWPKDECQERWTGGATSPRFTVCSSERFAALFTEQGRYGFVFDVQTGRVTLRLDRGYYYPEVQQFPIAFFEQQPEILVVHGTNWNRVDISDAASGQLLTERGPINCEGEQRPEHYLDYFYGKLLISPDQKWIVSDGWEWHPWAVTRRWRLDAWLQNVWESEDGKSQATFEVCGENWNLPMTWVGNERFAIVDYDENQVKTARIFDVETAQEINNFGGVDGEIWSDGSALFCSAPAGLQKWNPDDGTLREQLDGFRPQFRWGARFIEIKEGVMKVCE